MWTIARNIILSPQFSSFFWLTCYVCITLISFMRLHCLFPLYVGWWTAKMKKWSYIRLLNARYWCRSTLNMSLNITNIRPFITGPLNGPVLFFSRVSVVVCNTVGGPAAMCVAGRLPPGTWAVWRLSLYGGPVWLRPVRATLCCKTYIGNVYELLKAEWSEQLNVNKNTNHKTENKLHN